MITRPRGLGYHTVKSISMKKLPLIFLFLISSAQAQDDFEKAELARTKEDWKGALIYYERAAETGNPVAAHWIGTFYLEGLGVEKNPVYAASFFSLAANEGVVGSMVNLANMRLSGNGVSKDCKKAKEWVLKFSKGPMPPAWEKQIASCESTFNK